MRQNDEIATNNIIKWLWMVIDHLSDNKIGTLLRLHWINIEIISKLYKWDITRQKAHIMFAKITKSINCSYSEKKIMI